MKLFIGGVLLLICFIYYLFKISYHDVSYNEINNMIEFKKYDDAIYYIDNKLKKYPDNGLLYYKKAEILFIQNKLDEANDYLDKSIDLGFPLTLSYNLKAIICENKKDYDCQKNFAKKSIEIDPTDFEGYFILAKAYFNSGEFEKAYENFKIAYDIENDDNFLLYMAKSLIEIKKYDESINILYNLDKKYPDNRDILFYLYKSYKKYGYYNNAIYLLDKLYSITGDAFYIKEKSKFLYEVGDYVSAFFELKKYLNNTKNQSNEDLSFYKLLFKKVSSCNK